MATPSGASRSEAAGDDPKMRSSRGIPGGPPRQGDEARPAPHVCNGLQWCATVCSRLQRCAASNARQALQTFAASCN
eukprot:4212900-Alexandrium_andersonii.AAC.1